MYIIIIIIIFIIFIIIIIIIIDHGRTSSSICLSLHVMSNNATHSTCHTDVGGSHRECHLQRHQADGSSTEHNDVIAHLDVSPVASVDADGQRLHHGPLLKVH